MTTKLTNGKPGKPRSKLVGMQILSLSPGFQVLTSLLSYSVSTNLVVSILFLAHTYTVLHDALSSCISRARRAQDSSHASRFLVPHEMLNVSGLKFCKLRHYNHLVIIPICISYLLFVELHIL